MRDRAAKVRLCWRHGARLMILAYGCLLDLTGREYPRRARVILGDARRCPRCIALRPTRVSPATDRTDDA